MVTVIGQRVIHGLAYAVIGYAAASTMAVTVTIDFESQLHGEVVNTQVPGVTISADNFRSGGPDLAVIFDSRRRSTADPDLEGPNGLDGSWAQGNLAPGTVLGNLLIIQEHGPAVNGFVDRPDDEGSRPAGRFDLFFDKPIVAFGFDLVDVEGPLEWNNGGGFLAAFFDNGSLIHTVNFSQFIGPADDLYDPSVSFGDNSANRIVPITAGYLGVDSFDYVQIVMGGSGGIDNIQFMSEPVSLIVPLPPAAWAGLLMLGGLGVYRMVHRARQTNVH